MSRTTAQLRVLWSPACTGPFASVPLFGGASISVRASTVEAWQALNAVLQKWEYKATPPDCGAYNCRAITGGTQYSLHAYGIAADINWQQNPYGPVLITDMPRGMVDEIKAIRTNNGVNVFRWGGDYSGNKDAMHYEIVASPAEIATGIATGSQPIPTPEDEMASSYLRVNQPGDPSHGRVEVIDDFNRRWISPEELQLLVFFGAKVQDVTLATFTTLTANKTVNPIVVSGGTSTAPTAQANATATADLIAQRLQS
jgi:hypothetical protein